MKTDCIDVTTIPVNEMAIDRAAKLIQQGELVGMPTETVYGLAANALDAEAVKKIFEAKGRPSDNPLIVHLEDNENIGRYVKNISPKAYALMEAFWPGPLTLILEKEDIIPDITTAGLRSVGIRVPHHRVARALIKASGTAIAAPSGNRSGRPSPTRAKHMIADMDGRIPLILDGGACDVGVESTVIDMTTEPPIILRPGDVTQAMIEKIIGAVAMVKTISPQENINEPVKSPGMKYKHYAPNAEILLYKGERQDVMNTMNQQMKKMKKQGKKVGLLAFEENTGLLQCDNVIIIGSYYNYREIERNLFNALLEFEALNIDVIFAECVEEQDQGTAVMNRLLRAANYNIINV